MKAEMAKTEVTDDSVRWYLVFEGGPFALNKCKCGLHPTVTKSANALISSGVVVSCTCRSKPIKSQLGDPLSALKQWNELNG